MRITQISIVRGWHFHVARQLEKRGLLERIWTGYPKFKLKDENGVPQEKIMTYPWFQTLYMATRGRWGIDRLEGLNLEWTWIANKTLDKHVAKKLREEEDVLLGMSGCSLESGKRIKQLGGKYICDRGCSHIRYQTDILTEEYKKWGFRFWETDERSVLRDEAEYEVADRIAVPSEFARQSFIDLGVPESKLIKLPYGTNLSRFSKVGDPDPNKFVVLWVGGVSIRKGFMYALEAFKKIKHPNKEFIVIGVLSEEIEVLMRNEDLSKVKLLGKVQNTLLPKYYSEANVFILPSIEDGFGLVMGEALACGCPVIGSMNTGARDLYEHGKEGFIIPIRDSKALADAMQNLIDDPTLRERMSSAAIERVKTVKGWDYYGDQLVMQVEKLVNS